ncbi:HAD family hydrolase [Kitasatospora purpeofusca]|uniref:HAD family hydrolase n=1 Tax=Kitasatospora purpeofusca TaxID=67352 RepID=UPI002E1511EE|nr:HAD family hydrolase [Kitasatospora purpeofusca]
MTKPAKTTAAPAVETIATDVGGVLYYDEPFELVWLQGVLELAGEADPTLTIEHFTAEMRRFYLQRASATASPGLYSPAGTHAWTRVRRRWADLAQLVPGAVAALGALAEHRPVCVVANQPPECEEVLRASGAAEHLALVALDTTVGIAKPDPGLLGWAIEQLGWNPATTLMVGDRPDHDAAPAQRLGAHAALVTPPTGWSAPHGTDPALVAAYREVRAERLEVRRHPAADHSLHARDLADLATRLTDSALARRRPEVAR